MRLWNQIVGEDDEDDEDEDGEDSEDSDDWRGRREATLKLAEVGWLIRYASHRADAERWASPR